MINLYEIPEQTGGYGLNAHSLVSENFVKYRVLMTVRRSLNLGVVKINMHC